MQKRRTEASDQKLRIRTVFKIIKLLILIIITSRPHLLAKFTPGDRKQGINKCWPKNEHYRQKVGEMPKCIMSKFWSIIDSSLVHGRK